MGKVFQVLATAGAFAVAATATVCAQSKSEIKALVDASIPERQTTSFEYQLSTNLASKRAVNYNAVGRIEGRTRNEFQLEVNSWGSGRQALFLSSSAGIAFSEVPPPKGAPKGWRAYNALAEVTRDPVYAQLMLPQTFLATFPEYPEAFEEAGQRGEEGAQLQGHRAPIAPDRVKAILADKGLVLENGQKFESVQGTITLWVGAEDGLLQSVELALEAQIEEEKKPDAQGGGAPARAGGGDSWDFNDELDSNQGMMLARMRDPDGKDTGESGLGGAQAKTEELKKTYSIRLSLHRPGEGEKPPEAIRPDPEAAQLVSW